jgi:hypothetical protein
MEFDTGKPQFESCYRDQGVMENVTGATPFVPWYREQVVMESVTGPTQFESCYCEQGVMENGVGGFSDHVGPEVNERAWKGPLWLFLANHCGRSFGHTCFIC